MARTGSSTVSFEEAVDATRTGDLWIFRGGTVADRLIQTASNAPVNHVGMAVVLDDLPPLMWHAELGRSMRDHWTGDHHRGVQLHDLREAVTTWQGRYGQRAWLRQLSPDVGREQEDAVLKTIARLNGVSFPSTMGLAWRWLRGRDGYLSHRESERKGLRPEDAYCAEVVAVTLEEMGVLSADAPTNWYDPGRFWSGDTLPLKPGLDLRGRGRGGALVALTAHPRQAHGDHTHGQHDHRGQGAPRHRPHGDGDALPQQVGEDQLWTHLPGEPGPGDEGDAGQDHQPHRDAGRAGHARDPRGVGGAVVRRVDPVGERLEDVRNRS